MTFLFLVILGIIVETDLLVALVQGGDEVRSSFGSVGGIFLRESGLVSLVGNDLSRRELE